MSRGHAVDDSTKARKDNVRLARDVAIGHQVNRCLIHPHTDALVVTLNVANGRVFWILIDIESSANILFTSAFHQMNVGGATPRPIKTLLYGVGRERVYVEGAIQLQVSIGQRPAQVTQTVDFLLVEQPFACNAIIG